MSLDLRLDIEAVINKWSAENGSNTPDHILARYLVACLFAFDAAVNEREKWYGRTAPPAEAEGTPLLPKVGEIVTRQYAPAMAALDAALAYLSKIQPITEEGVGGLLDTKDKIRDALATVRGGG